jgi:hypothetical protein
MLQLWSISVTPMVGDCPHCGKNFGNHLEIHEVLVHPEKRERFWTPEYREWKAEQEKSLAKKKRKNSG